MVDLFEMAPEVQALLRKKSMARIHQRDPEAWLWDVLNKRWWSKQSEIGHTAVNPAKPQTQTIVKSCNGIGKTAIAGDLATWAVSAFDPMEVTVLLTAPIFGQIKANTFRYIADNYSTAQAKQIFLPGNITSVPSLRVDRDGGGLPKDAIQAKRPADSNLISSFQGTHDGFVVVIMDEAGGLPEDLWIGANAVTTNEHVLILAIGNPDELNTAFHARFVDRERYQEWQPITIAAHDSPNFTGEMIYPDDLERDRAVKKNLLQVSWAEMMKRQAHPNVYLAKVMGEFPKDGDTSFFTQATINMAFNTEFEPGQSEDRFLGVDLSFRGEDKTIFCLNDGGRIRKVHEYNGEDNPRIHAQIIHKFAKEYGVKEVRVDAAGAGDAVFVMLAEEEEFADGDYTLYGVRGGTASPDNNVWTRLRSWQYDKFRIGMQTSKIDLDPEDKEMRDQLNVQTYSVDRVKRAIQITPKADMKAAGLKSPDVLDAAIYSWAPPDALYGVESDEPGKRVEFDVDDSASMQSDSTFFAMDFA